MFVHRTIVFTSVTQQVALEHTQRLNVFPRWRWWKTPKQPVDVVVEFKCISSFREILLAGIVHLSQKKRVEKTMRNVSISPWKPIHPSSAFNEISPCCRRDLWAQRPMSSGFRSANNVFDIWWVNNYMRKNGGEIARVFQSMHLRCEMRKLCKPSDPFNRFMKSGVEFFLSFISQRRKCAENVSMSSEWLTESQILVRWGEFAFDCSSCFTIAQSKFEGFVAGKEWLIVIDIGNEIKEFNW